MNFVINKDNLDQALQFIVQKVVKENKVVNLDFDELDEEYERSFYKDPQNPKRFDYDVIDKEFTAKEAIDFLNELYK